MSYEDLLIEADNNGLIVKEKTCILAEELGHYHTTVGNIHDQTSMENRKQERASRLWP